MLRTMLTRRMPIKGPRTKKCAVKTCRAPFVPEKTFITWCSPDCGHAIALGKLAKQKTAQARAARKVIRDDRTETKTKLESFKTRGEHIAATQTAFNALVRFRDRNEVCISCDTVLSTLDNELGGGYDCGHYRSRGSAPHLRFDLRNAHGQCKKCNRYRAGNASEYRIGLIARYGIAFVEALECDQAGGGWTIPALLEMKADFRAQLRALKENA